MNGSRFVKLALFAMFVFGSVGTAFADYVFTTIDPAGSTFTIATGINDSGQKV